MQAAHPQPNFLGVPPPPSGGGRDSKLASIFFRSRGDPLQMFKQPREMLSYEFVVSLLFFLVFRFPT